MARNLVAAVFVAILGVAAMFQGTSAATYTVGDATGWRVPSNVNFYDDWTDNKTFRVGDVLVFNFATGAHDVVEVGTENAFDTCAGANPVRTITTGPASITLNRTGEYYFICTIGTHCTSGQKVKIDVEMSTTPGTSPTPGASPTTPSGTNTTTSTTTPAPSSASSLVSTLSLVFVSIAFVLFF
ncbi:Plastocyanin-like protein [Corchorus capsularis]|uniref:Plastocyanin-like protein n=1 Tax=Corchorus capsularis TaxID=210143 RepID=A0A1R3IEV6_COCAP|nr:Plastocyanin-like protein [Corchorus capsularis]